MRQRTRLCLVSLEDNDVCRNYVEGLLCLGKLFTTVEDVAAWRAACLGWLLLWTNAVTVQNLKMSRKGDQRTRDLHQQSTRKQ